MCRAGRIASTTRLGAWRAHTRAPTTLARPCALATSAPINHAIATAAAAAATATTTRTTGQAASVCDRKATRTVTSCKVGAMRQHLRVTLDWLRMCGAGAAQCVRASCARRLGVARSTIARTVCACAVCATNTQVAAWRTWPANAQAAPCAVLPRLCAAPCCAVRTRSAAQTASATHVRATCSACGAACALPLPKSATKKPRPCSPSLQPRLCPSARRARTVAAHIATAPSSSVARAFAR